MKNSILQTRKECYCTGRTDNLHYHHIYGGARRPISDKYGFGVYLTGEYHNQSNKGVHFNHELDLYLKQTCQKRFETQRTRAEFMALIGKNYL